MLTEPLDSLESIGRSPRSEMERSGIELHDGVERRIYFIPRADTGAAPAPHVQPEKNHGIKIESNKNK